MSRRPALHFLALGACLFALETAWTRVHAAVAAAPVAASLADGAAGSAATGEERRGRLRREWLAQRGRLPSESELRALERREQDEELLLREARARGFQLSDSLVRRRLVLNMRFLLEASGAASEGAAAERDAPERSDEELFRAALALGMDRSDLVVRRRLIQKLELSLRAEARAEEPHEAELAAYLARHPERFAEPARVRLSHVFLSRDTRGDHLAADAAALLAELREENVPPAAAASLGDPFLSGHQLSSRSQGDLAREFGDEFARAVFALEPGGWEGPVASSYGLHLVFVHERVAGHPVALETVRGAVREALLAERGEARLAQELARLRARP